MKIFDLRIDQFDHTFDLMEEILYLERSSHKYSTMFVVPCDWNDARVIFSDSVCPEKTNCESDSGLLSSGGKDPLDPEGNNAGSQQSVIGSIESFQVRRRSASLPIVGEYRKASLDTQVLLDVIALNR